MTRWKVVPVEPTSEMLTALYLDSDEHGFARADYALMLAAAPAWEPSDEACARMIRMMDPSDEPRVYSQHYIRKARAAILAAVGGGS